MKHEGRKHYKDKHKTDYHVKKIFANSNEKPKKGTETYYKKNQYTHWWEDICVEGSGKLKQNLQNEINEELLNKGY